MEKGESSMSERHASSIERLQRQHRGLDSQVHELMGRTYLTPTEQMRARILKKKRLSTKDKIFALKRLMAP